MQKYIKKTVLFLLATAVAVTCASLFTVKAATLTASNGAVRLLNDYKGRYKLNFTGNTNHFDQWDDDSEELYVTRNFKDRSDIPSENNSTGMLTRGAEDARIAKAFLIWETRASSGVNTPVYLYAPNNTRHSIPAQAACVDTRTDPSGSWSYNSLYCMAADVTDIVQSAGYGAYTVANIPVWQKTAGAVDYNTGGESIASWQLIIVEESDTYAVRNVTLNIVSKFYMEQNFGLSMISAVASKSTGEVNGQIFYGTSNSGMDRMVETYQTFDAGGNVVKSGVSNATTQAGLYKNGAAFNTRDQGRMNGWANGTVRMSLSDITDIGNDVTKLRMLIENSGWTTTFVLGMTYDINMYTVSYDGNGAQSGRVERQVCLFNREYSISDNTNPGFSYSHHRFIGWNTKADGSGTWWYPGDTYSNLCSVSGADYKLYAQWEPLGATITLDNQGADLQAGTPKYFEKYNVGNYTDDDCLTPITQIEKPQKTGQVFCGYYTEKKGKGIPYVDKDGVIKSTPTTFTTDTTLYAYWVPAVYKITLDNQGARSAGTTCYYEKYGDGNYADADCTIPIYSIEKPQYRGETYAGYYTEKKGQGNVCINADGVICTTSTQFTQDTTIYAHKTPNTYTIWCDNQGATFSGSTFFNELYGKAFYYDATVFLDGVTEIPYDYTGNVQCFVAPYTGWYVLKTWGAQGGTIAHNGDGYGFAVGAGGAGGFSQGDIFLTQGEILSIYVGGAGSDIAGGYNGGGFATGWNAADHCMAGGGGATDIRRYGTGFDNRVIIAGGGGGGAIYMNTGIPGGTGGGTAWTATYCNYYNNHGVVSINTNPVNLNRTYGYSTAGGGGGGAFGGGGYDYGLVVTGGEGGIGYIGGVANGISLEGQKTGNGYATVTRFNYGAQYTMTTRIEVPTKAGFKFLGYFEGYNGAGRKIVNSDGTIAVPTTFFEADTTIHAYWVPDNQILTETYNIQYNGNGADYGDMSHKMTTIPYCGNFTIADNAFTKLGYTFENWAVTRTRPLFDAYGNQTGTIEEVFCTDGTWQPLFQVPDSRQWERYQSGWSFVLDHNWVADAYVPATYTFYAQWKPTYCIQCDVILTAGSGIESVSGDGAYTVGTQVNIAAEVLPGYHWLNWTGTYYADTKDYRFTMPAQNVTMTANATANQYTIQFDGNGATGGSMNPMSCIYDVSYSLTPNVYTRDGYQFLKWNTKPDGTGDSYENGATVKNLTTTNNDTVTLYAQWEANSYTIVFDANGGTGDIPSAQVRYDRNITLPDGAASYHKFTIDGSNVTDEVLAGTVVPVGYEAPEGLESIVEEAPVIEAEESDAEAVSLFTEEETLPKAYPSVFTGWALEEGKDAFAPQWTLEEVAVSTIVDAAGMTNMDGATIVLYAVWDDCPWIQAADIYYTLEQAQSGFITAEEILSHATASDREDGSPILPGIHENGTSFSIPDYAPTDFTQFDSEGSCTENLTVVDSTGSVYAKQITVYVVDTTPVAVKPEGTTRFINEYYYNQPYENGGLENDSVWKTNPEYVAAIQTAFDNLKNDTPLQTYYFTHEDILEMKNYMDENGMGNTKQEDVLQQFYHQFLVSNQVL